MPRTLAGTLALASILVPTAMLASAYYLDRRISSCSGDWSDGQQSAYNWLVGASPFVAAALTFAGFAVSGIKWRYLLATVVGMCSFALFGISALVVVYYECA
jgi:hypothetical protein